MAIAIAILQHDQIAIHVGATMRGRVSDVFYCKLVLSDVFSVPDISLTVPNNAKREFCVDWGRHVVRDEK
jgi:hypothetical protein